MTTLDFAQYLFVGLGGFAIFVYYAASFAEEGLAPEVRGRFSAAIKNFNFASSVRVAFSTFAVSADHYYGHGIFTWKALGRSALLSFVWVFLLFSVSLFAKRNDQFFLPPMIGGRHLAVFGSSIIVLTSGIAIDYLSTCLTRFLIRWSIAKSPTVVSAVLISDFMISVILFYVLFVMTKHVVLSQSWMSPKVAFEEWIKLGQYMVSGVVTIDMIPGAPETSELEGDIQSGSLQFLDPNSKAPVGKGQMQIRYAFPDGILFFSSLLTSIWMWLYVAAYWALLVALRIDRLNRACIRYLDIDHHPFKALGIVLIFLCALCACIAIAVFSALHRI